MATIPIFNATTPFLGQIPGGFRPSLMVRFKGKIQGRGRCNIDFVSTPALNTKQDIIFHISIRPSEKVIVRNHFHNGNFGLEERYGPCRVKKNETFEIVLLAELQHYKIAVNGHHLGVFRHRLPLNLVQFINVSGEVTIDHILLEQDQQSAQQQMILSQVMATPSAPVMSVSMPSYTPLQVHHQQGPPPSYYPNNLPPQPHSTITRIGGITIERRVQPCTTGTIVVTQHGHSSNVYRF